MSRKIPFSLKVFGSAVNTVRPFQETVRRCGESKIRGGGPADRLPTGGAGGGFGFCVGCHNLVVVNVFLVGGFFVPFDVALASVWVECDRSEYFPVA